MSKVARTIEEKTVEMKMIHTTKTIKSPLFIILIILYVLSIFLHKWWSRVTNEKHEKNINIHASNEIHTISWELSASVFFQSFTGLNLPVHIVAVCLKGQS